MTTKYEVRRRKDGAWGIYVVGMAVMVAEFKQGCQIDARYIGQVLNAAPELLAACEKALEALEDLHGKAVPGTEPYCEICEVVMPRLEAALARARADSEEAA